MKELTRAEEQIMHVLWFLGQAYVKDIIERLPEPKPAYNTVSTIVRILEKKGFVGHEAFGKTHLYHPLVAKEDYTQAFLRSFVRELLRQFLPGPGLLLRQGPGHEPVRARGDPRPPCARRSGSRKRKRHELNWSRIS